MKKILFICTGNTCRSPMAEGFFRAALKDNGNLYGKFCVSSAGIAALEGDSASVHSVTVLENDWGIDISAHKARNADEREINDADLILTMTQSHKNAVLEKFPQAKGKVYTLKEYVMGNGSGHGSGTSRYELDIADPYGASLEVYRLCAREIKKAIDRLLEILSDNKNMF